MLMSVHSEKKNDTRNGCISAANCINLNISIVNIIHYHLSKYEQPTFYVKAYALEP
jgi:hypothetical protein